MAQATDTSDQKRQDDALKWFVRLNSGEATAEDFTAFKKWRDASARNFYEYNKLEAVWGDLSAMGDPRASSMGRNLPSKNMSRRLFLAGGATASMAAGYTAIFGLPGYFFHDYYTGIGERKSVTLPDGSHAELDADTAITLSFSQNERRLHLKQGRAFFDVAKDIARPFIVEASDGVVRAMGTQFTVHLRQRNVAVSVEESAVSILAPDQNELLVSAGQSTSYDSDGLAGIGVTDQDTMRAWREGRIIFESQPLWQVVADVNRYRAGRIYITDSKLADLQVSGVFDITKPDEVLQAISTTLPVQAVELTQYLVLLRPTA